MLERRHFTFCSQHQKAHLPAEPLVTPMRSIFFVGLVIAVFARSSAVTAFTNTDDSQLLSNAAPDFATNILVNTDTQKRFLRVTDPDDDDLAVDDEERGGRFGSLEEIIKKLDDQTAEQARKIANMSKLKKLKEKLAPDEYEALNGLLKLNNNV
ncbi:unnamed protein product [Phytophthora lilii]|uniref:RxLR effector protein n=1 Tax=Phytophthora lilii TaxID=2077276 RepID=A0A9W6XL02_9STRA|nr:unnamed protein product [Phytophthora lilii]